MYTCRGSNPPQYGTGKSGPRVMIYDPSPSRSVLSSNKSTKFNLLILQHSTLPNTYIHTAGNPQIQSHHLMKIKTEMKRINTNTRSKIASTLRSSYTKIRKESSKRMKAVLATAAELVNTMRGSPRSPSTSQRLHPVVCQILKSHPSQRT